VRSSSLKHILIEYLELKMIKEYNLPKGKLDEVYLKGMEELDKG